VYIRNYSGMRRWIPGTVIDRFGYHSFNVKTDEGKVVRRHINQMKKAHHSIQEDRDTSKDDGAMHEQDEVFQNPEAEVQIDEAPRSPCIKRKSFECLEEPSQVEEPSQRRYPLRDRHPPSRLQIKGEGVSYM
jgi:hypothetical protein